MGLQYAQWQVRILSTSYHQHPNRVIWKTIRGSREKYAKYVSTMERRRMWHHLVEYLPFQKLASVFYLGKHIFTMKLETETRKTEIKRKAHGTIPKTLSAKRVAIEQMGNLTGEGRIDVAKNEAENWVDTRMAKRV